jgi:homoserine O-acetyltransferase/O-succinyltransferase
MTNADITQNAVVVAPRPALIRGYLVLLNLLTIGVTAAIYLTICLSLPAYADDQSPRQLTQSSNQTLSPIWDRSENTAAKQNDVWFDNYRFRDGETAQRLRIHYVTLGTHRNAHGDIDNAVLVLHWTGADSSTLLGPAYMRALFDPGRPLDAGR